MEKARLHVTALSPWLKANATSGDPDAMSEAFQKKVLDQLRENGSDISKPHVFEFYLYVPTKLNANKTADKIRQSGFSCKVVSRSASDDSWLCIASKTIILEKANLANHARFFEQIATAVGADFDGWEAEIIEE